LPGKIPLTPATARVVCREAAEKTFGVVARCLEEDWGRRVHAADVQGWAEAIGAEVVEQRQAERIAFEQGRPPMSLEAAPELLVVGMDGGRYQSREKNPETQSRWRENKVLSIISYQPGDGRDRMPKPLVATLLATAACSEDFGKLVRVEAERRGLSRAKVVLNLSDGGPWIDSVDQREHLSDFRIIDFYHAAEHLYASAKALCGATPAAYAQWQKLKTWLWEGKTSQIIGWLEQAHSQLGPLQDADVKEHPRRVIANDLEYFRKHQCHMKYDEYRSKGWPIGSGPTEAAVKQFNKRVKGTEQFWNVEGVEAIMALRALWRSEDQRWERYWMSRPAYQKAA
jgi:hypothetical protein